LPYGSSSNNVTLACAAPALKPRNPMSASNQFCMAMPRQQMSKRFANALN
jgi:hypothetical protein